MIFRDNQVSREVVLKARIHDLEAQQNLINDWIVENEQWYITECSLQQSYSNEDIQTVNVDCIYRASDVERAKQLADKELNSIQNSTEA